MRQEPTRSGPRPIFFVVVLVLAMLSPSIGACAAPTPAGPAITVQDIWARSAQGMGGQATEGQESMGHGGAGNGAVYMIIANQGSEPERLIGANADVANAVEIHETTMEGDVMRMQQLTGGLEIPAGTEVTLEPGGYHVMLIGLNRDLAIGDRFPLALQFAESGEMVVEAEVRQP